MDNLMGRNDERVRCQGILHIVKKGDTLYKIAKMHNVPLTRVMFANPYVDVYNLQPGDEICVPVMTPRPPMNDSQTGNRPPMNGSQTGNRPPMNDNQTGNRPPMNDNQTGNRPPMIQPRPWMEENGTVENGMPGPGPVMPEMNGGQMDDMLSPDGGSKAGRMK